jgi:glycosyltransferase involved in cell wall biosynthesis
VTRIGVNPARGGITHYRPASVSVAVLTYIPSLEGYFEQRLEVLKLVLASLEAHTSSPHDLFVFDNGSCESVVDYLRSLRLGGRLDYLLLSQRNIGKIDALKILFQATPGEWIAYSDDDILFYPGWLEAQLEVMERFSQVGMVSGVPVRNAAGHASSSLERLAASAPTGIEVVRERRIPDEWEEDWAFSTGRDPQAHLQATQDQLDLVFKAENPSGLGIVEAIGAANHFQFLARKQTILKALPVEWSGKLMGSMIELDQAIDQLGLLRLSTARRYTRHLGNQISPQVWQEAQQMGLLQLAGLKTGSRPLERRTRRKHWLLRIPGARGFLHASYRRLFQILFN